MAWRRSLSIHKRVGGGARTHPSRADPRDRRTARPPPARPSGAGSQRAAQPGAVSRVRVLASPQTPGDGVTICPDAVPPDVVRPVDLELLESRVERSGYSVDPYRAMSHRDAPLTPKRVLYNGQ